MPQKKFDAQGTLHKKTFDLVKKDDRSLAELSTDTGLPFYWLQRFSQGAFKNPSVNRVQHLYEKLTGKPLKV
jgi:hypothetical protein